MADIPAASPMAVTVREMLTQFLLAAGQADQARQLAGVAAAKGQNPAAIASMPRRCSRVDGSTRRRNRRNGLSNSTGQIHSSPVFVPG